MSNYRRKARRKAMGVSDADSKAMDQAFGYTPVDECKIIDYRLKSERELIEKGRAIDQEIEERM